jgi:hypothetical protein
MNIELEVRSLQPVSSGYTREHRLERFREIEVRVSTLNNEIRATG